MLFDALNLEWKEQGQDIDQFGSNLGFYHILPIGVTIYKGSKHFQKIFFFWPGLLIIYMLGFYHIKQPKT